MNKIKPGLYPPMITIFKKDESLDEEAIREHVDWLIENEVHGIIPTGSTGEFIAMKVDEIKRVIEIVVDQANGRVPVVAGTHHHSTKITIELSRFAQDVGADGVMIVPPYYLKPTLREIYAHYKEISENIDIPIMLYNNPWFSGVDIPPKFIAKLAEENIIWAVKEAHGDPSRIQELKYLAGDKLTIFYGHDVNVIGGLAVGAEGWVCGLANAAPRELRRLFDLIVIEKDLEKARQLWYKLYPWLRINWINEVEPGCRPYWPQIIKYTLQLRGRKAGWPRKPLLPLTDEEKEIVRKTAMEAGLIKQKF